MLAAGPGWLDRCLIVCHGSGSSLAGAPPCHEHEGGSTDRPVWQSADTCHHDHDGTIVQAADPRQVAASRLMAVAPDAHAVAAPLQPADRLVVAAASPPPRVSPVLSLPLRI